MAVTNNRPTAGQGITALAAALAVVAYPYLGEWLLERYGVERVATALIAVAALNVAVRVVLERRPLVLFVQFGAVFALLTCAAMTGDRFYLQLFPALVNAVLAVLFATSLATSKSMIERGARALQPNLPAFTRDYCRAVTVLWVVFFAAFSGAIVVVAVSSPGAWREVTTTFYVGGMIALILVEACVRKLWFRNYGDGPIDGVIARWFPATATERGRKSAAYIAKMHALGYAPGGEREGQIYAPDAD